MLRRAPQEAAALLDAAVARLLAAAPTNAAIALLGEIDPALLAPVPAPVVDPTAPLRFPSIPAGFGGRASTCSRPPARDGSRRCPPRSRRQLPRPTRRAPPSWPSPPPAARCWPPRSAARSPTRSRPPRRPCATPPTRAPRASGPPPAAPSCSTPAASLRRRRGGAARRDAPADRRPASAALPPATGPLADGSGSTLACAYDRPALAARRVLVLAALAACDRDGAQRAAAPLLARLDDGAPRVRSAARTLAARLAEADGDHARVTWIFRTGYKLRPETNRRKIWGAAALRLYGNRDETDRLGGNPGRTPPDAGAARCGSRRRRRCSARAARCAADVRRRAAGRSGGQGGPALRCAFMAKASSDEALAAAGVERRASLQVTNAARAFGVSEPRGQSGIHSSFQYPARAPPTAGGSSRSARGTRR